MSDTTLSGLTADLARYSRELGGAQAMLKESEWRAVNARARAEVAEARAFLAASGNVEERKKQARIDAQELILEAEIADAGVRADRSNLKVISQKIDVGRTLISSARAEMQSFGGAT